MRLQEELLVVARQHILTQDIRSSVRWFLGDLSILLCSIRASPSLWLLIAAIFPQLSRSIWIQGMRLELRSQPWWLLDIDVVSIDVGVKVTVKVFH